MRHFYFILLFITPHFLCCQSSKTNEKLVNTPDGYDYIPFEYQGEQVDIAIVTGGEDYTTWKKPLFLIQFDQGAIDFFNWLKSN